MTPGYIGTAHRGGSGTFYTGRTATGFVSNRAYGTSGRTFAPQRQRFAVAPNEGGGHSIHLDDNESATLTLNEDGSLTVTVENKPQADDSGNGNGGNGNGAPLVVEESQRGFRSLLRSGVARVSKMSWERNPSDGSITFMPSDGEVIDVSRDAIQAVVSAHPTSEPGRPA